MQIQFITTQEDLQSVIALAVNKAFGELTLTPNTPVDPVEIVDTKELCARLDITEPTVIRYRKKGKIPFMQIGSAIRFDYYKVVAALDAGKKKGTKVL